MTRLLSRTELTLELGRVITGVPPVVGRDSVWEADIRRTGMLWTICVIVLVLWALGMVTAYTMGGLIHILLVVAIVSVLVRLIQGRRVFD